MLAIFLNEYKQFAKTQNFEFNLVRLRQKTQA